MNKPTPGYQSRRVDLSLTHIVPCALSQTFKEIGIAHPSSEVLRNVMGGDLGLTFNNSDELSPSFHMNMKIADATPHDLPDNLYDKLLQFHEVARNGRANTVKMPL